MGLEVGSLAQVCHGGLTECALLEHRVVAVKGTIDCLLEIGPSPLWHVGERMNVKAADSLPDVYPAKFPAPTSVPLCKALCSLLKLFQGVSEFRKLDGQVSVEPNT